jgi:transposase
VRSLGTIPNCLESVRKLIKKLGPAEKLRVCYVAGPTGYVVYWQLAELGVKCDVVAPTLVPVKAGARVKTDRRDAEKLARSHRSGDLTAVWVPDETPRHCTIWCVRAKQRSRISCGLVIG